MKIHELISELSKHEGNEDAEQVLDSIFQTKEVEPEPGPLDGAKVEDEKQPE